MHVQHQKSPFALFLFLSVGFLEYFGIGLVFPMFTFLLFDPASGILPPDAPDAIRGIWLGVLFGISPAIQFFMAPVFGTLSDMKGRKRILVYCLIIAFSSYLIGTFAILSSNLHLLIISRFIYGISAGSLTVVQAGVVDLSQKKDKQKNFGLYTMALGMGSTLGPFMGGVLTKPTTEGWFNYSTPFIAAAILTLINLVVILWKLPETHLVPVIKKINWTAGLMHLKKAFQIKELRHLFLAMFIFFFGWHFFSKFVTILLLQDFHFSQTDIGTYYAFNGLLFVVCAGYLIRPVVTNFTPQRVLEVSLVLAGIYFFLFFTIKQDWLIYLFHIPLIYMISMILPVATTIVSNDTSPDAQGEVLGIFGSVQSLALVLSPFGAGSVVSQYPYVSVIVGGTAFLLAGILLLIFRFITPKEPKTLA